MSRPVLTTESRSIEDGEVLTQYGTADAAFRKEPRVTDFGVISLILGAVDPLAAAAIVRGRGRLGDGTDAVRHTTAGRLRSRGFTVTHSPSRRNSLHVSAGCDGVWNEEAFDQCFAGAQVGPALTEENKEEDDRAES